MNVRRILLLGKTGQVGYELMRSCQSLGEVTALGRVDLDCQDLVAVRNLLSRCKPDLILNAVAYTAVDHAETERERATLLNSELPAVLSAHCLRNNVPLVHYSTDYVYDGSSEVPYVESHATAPLNHYGWTKLSGDINIQQSGAPHLIFRTSWVYATRGRNFLRTILDRWKAGGMLRVVNDQQGAPTSARLIAEATAQSLAVIAGNSEGFPAERFRQFSGIYHLSAAGGTTWFEFAEAFLPAGAGKSGRLIPIKTADYPTGARRPKYSILCTNKLTNAFGIQLPQWREVLGLVLQEAVAQTGQS